LYSFGAAPLYPGIPRISSQKFAIRGYQNITDNARFPVFLLPIYTETQSESSAKHFCKHCYLRRKTGQFQREIRPCRRHDLRHSACNADVLIINNRWT